MKFLKAPDGSLYGLTAMMCDVVTANPDAEVIVTIAIKTKDKHYSETISHSPKNLKVVDDEGCK